MNVLVLYNATQTYTITVFEHLFCMARDSKHRFFFAHIDQHAEFCADLTRFDAVGIHYTVRLPFDQVSSSVSSALTDFNGLKFLFIQDEYDHTHRAWHWIKQLGMQLVFTVVPEAGVGRIYPESEFPGVRFVSNLTGYVPEGLGNGFSVLPPSKRTLMIGYRGRPLPVRYGTLGMEKVAVGKITKNYCDAHGIETDISWSEGARIYGTKWYEFMLTCRSMLGSESGSNVFDWDGSLVKHIAEYRKQYPKASDDEVYARMVREHEIDGIMNQVSPRVFEAIAARTILVLFEGNYSGVVRPHEHFIPLKKDGSNLAEVVSLLQDDAYVDAMAERAYKDVIASGKYSYHAFVKMVDLELSTRMQECVSDHRLASWAGSNDYVGVPTLITTEPIRAVVGKPNDGIGLWNVASKAWMMLPESSRNNLRPFVRRLMRKGRG